MSSSVRDAWIEPAGRAGGGLLTARALIVEDEPLVAELLEDMLREAGYEIAACVGALDKALKLS